MSRHRTLAATALLTSALSLAGCGVLGGAGNTPTPAATTGAAAAKSGAPAATKSAPAPTKSAAPAGLPDICTLLTRSEVTGLTGQKVTLMTNEGGDTGGARYCQWQLTSGQLDVTVNVETRQQFDVQNKEAQQVAGIGEAAYSLAGHLYVYAGGKVVDVYATSAGNDAGNLKVERRTAEAVLPKLG
ncbi:DUF3558 family protein [Dactylosporangium aurantiacum]|uniref:DUF3558 family protein n=1 Tax=Dactylosporangium aurantiacum TaxID=35754 RepID=A0A9Q9MGC3_9ACTN|nr:DUF3558 family protein [Dactylosporangium aurantiacum]MDG6107182.1 DUF3558 family protein [Dactylosporangium aurantiacum]UWZ51476.1 DUF3558 family protein [Dactylosporangium aurantiacum]